MQNVAAGLESLVRVNDRRSTDYVAVRCWSDRDVASPAPLGLPAECVAEPGPLVDTLLQDGFLNLLFAKSEDVIDCRLNGQYSSLPCETSEWPRSPLAYAHRVSQHTDLPMMHAVRTLPGDESPLLQTPPPLRCGASPSVTNQLVVPSVFPETCICPSATLQSAQPPWAGDRSLSTSVLLSVASLDGDSPTSFATLSCSEADGIAIPLLALYAERAPLPTSPPPSPATPRNKTAAITRFALAELEAVEGPPEFARALTESLVRLEESEDSSTMEAKAGCSAASSVAADRSASPSAASTCSSSTSHGMSTPRSRRPYPCGMSPSPQMLGRAPAMSIERTPSSDQFLIEEGADSSPRGSSASSGEESPPPARCCRGVSRRWHVWRVF